MLLQFFCLAERCHIGMHNGATKQGVLDFTQIILPTDHYISNQEITTRNKYETIS